MYPWSGKEFLPVEGNGCIMMQEDETQNTRHESETAASHISEVYRNRTGCL